MVLPLPWFNDLADSDTTRCEEKDETSNVVIAPTRRLLLALSFAGCLRYPLLKFDETLAFLRQVARKSLCDA
jgi:hypothetical protein